VARKGQFHLGGRDATTIIEDAHLLTPAASYFQPNLARTGVNRIFD
jgi:hypothetical protein